MATFPLSCLREVKLKFKIRAYTQSRYQEELIRKDLYDRDFLKNHETDQMMI